MTPDNAIAREYFETANLFVTGGAGTLGYAIARARKNYGWKGNLIVYSTDSHKHEKMHREFPDVHFVQGDIRNADLLLAAMTGSEVVVHGAAVKIIPVSEQWCMDTFDVNVSGSQVVCECAVRAGVKTVIGISTDKACHPSNAYGASKYMMEKLFQEYARSYTHVTFNLTRYGNVLESNGSVLQVWQRAFQNGERIKITDPEMTRFWLSPAQAVELICASTLCPTGTILVPKLSALSIGELAEYTVGEDAVKNAEIIPVRPGEKKHETLLTPEEGWYASEYEEFYVLYPLLAERNKEPIAPFSSDIAPKLTREEFAKLIKND